MYIFRKIVFTFTVNTVVFLLLTKRTMGKKFQFARRMKTDSDDMSVYTFETLTGRGINDCIKSCQAKKRCKFINYDLKARSCFLIGTQVEESFQIENYLEVKSGFYFGDKRGWNVEDHSVCERCSEYGACKIVEESDNSVCLNSGCGPPEKKKNSLLLVEMFSVGNKIEYECIKGYKTSMAVALNSMCFENGTWSAIEVDCLPEDVYEFNGIFYKLIREANDWDLAYEACSNIDGYLADIKSEEEQHFIVETLTAVDNFNCYWIGAKRSGDGFIWLDGTAVGYGGWHGGQPNNDGYMGNSQNCIELLRGFGYEWNDRECSKQCHVICELKFI